MKILFVCTGNTCRSPMAEALYKRASVTAGRTDEVRSRGVGVWSHMPLGDQIPQPLSAAVMRQYYDLDISRHVPVEADARDIEWADLILAMKKQHVIELHHKFGENKPLDSKLHTFGNYLGLQGASVEDPFGKPYDVYLRCAKQLEAWTSMLVEKLDSKASSAYRLV